MAGAAKPAPPERVRASVDLVFRRRAGQLVATLTRVFGIEHLELAEDVVHDAFVQALRRWPHGGIPDDPGAWILRVARNRALDVLRRKGRWRERAAEVERAILPAPRGDHGARPHFSAEVGDDQLRLMFACCHPALSRDAQVALTLGTVGGFGVDEIARAFLVSRATVAQRVVRAKRTLRERGATLDVPVGEELAGRRASVLETLYLMFNEGYAALEGDDLVRSDLCGEAHRLAELVAAHEALGDPSVHALAALFGFLLARQPARTDAAGELVPLARQDRSLWHRGALRRALQHLRLAARGDAVTSYHLQAEIASCHSLADSWADTDWPRILDRYDALLSIQPSPIVALNRVVAYAEVHGPGAALRELAAVGDPAALEAYEARWAVEGDLLARLGRAPESAAAYGRAIALTRSGPVRRHLARRAAQWGGGAESEGPGESGRAAESGGGAASAESAYRRRSASPEGRPAGGGPRRRAGVACLLLAAGAAVMPASAAAQGDAAFAFLLGRWEGAGELFGRPAAFVMEWRPALDGRFVELSFENAFRQPDGANAIVLRATAFYAADTPHAGVWVDTRGQILRLVAEASDSVVVARWTAETEEGRTTYRLAAPGRIEVVDEVLGEDGWRVFARAEYGRVEVAGGGP